MSKRSASSAPVGRAGKSAPRTTRRRRIDFSDIPNPTPEQLQAMRRVGRPPLGAQARQLIAIRVDPQVLEELRSEAKRRRMGYQTLINEVLARHTGSRSAAPHETIREPFTISVRPRSNP